MARFTFLGHACFLVEEGEHRLLFDPYLEGNPRAPVKWQELHPNYILVSHMHQDHFGNTIEIAKANESKVISSAEIARYCNEQGVDAHNMHIGGGYNFPFGRVKLTPAFHGAGIAGGHACGFLVTMQSTTFYYAGDTSLFGDMRFINNNNSLNIAFLPIGDNFTMGIDDALTATKFLHPDKVVPVHYNTWPLVKADPTLFADLIKEETESECIILNPGESIEA